MAIQEIRKDIAVLGVGTPKDKELMVAAWAAARQVGLPVNVILISNLQRILESGVRAIPALIVEGRVICEGSLPSVAEIAASLQAIYENTAAPL